MSWRQRLVWLVRWAITVFVCVVLLLAHDILIAGLVVLIAIVGSVYQLRRRSRSPRVDVVTWAAALKHSSEDVPQERSIDPDRPVVGMIVRGPGAGRYVNAVPAPESGFVYRVGPHPRGESEVLRGDAVIDMSPGAIRYLPQSPLSDELWRRNYHSLRRGDVFHALPLRGADPSTGALASEPS